MIKRHKLSQQNGRRIRPHAQSSPSAKPQPTYRHPRRATARCCLAPIHTSALAPYPRP
ncbi:MAG: hypothetical protein F6K62_21515 [Sphaerospermopsis sp. SIO1G2]|nr:hypothetical protein [Sphaerospermopsis sp. SIO1G2]